MIRSLRHHLAAMAGLGACLWLLAATASRLPSPPAEPTRLPGWWAATDPALAVGGLLNVVASLACGYLLVVTAADLVATVARLRLLSELAHRVAPAAWRTIVLRPVAAGALAVPALAWPVAGPTPALAATTDEVPTGDITGAGDPLVLTLTWLGPDDHVDAPAPTTTTTTPPPRELSLDVPDDAAAPAPPPSPAPPTPTPTESETPSGRTSEHRVVPGESLWSIAEDHLATLRGPGVGDAEVARYWRAVIAANRDRLPVPANPDLIFPGSTIVLPDAS